MPLLFPLQFLYALTAPMYGQLASDYPFVYDDALRLLHFFKACDAFHMPCMTEHIHHARMGQLVAFF